MTNVLLRKSFLVKLLAVVVTVALMLTVAPFAEIANFALTANAEEEYDYTKFGSVSSNGNTHTAVPANDGVGFRGWFKDGKEVSYEKTIDLTDFEDKDIKNYTPMFYNFNLIADPGFENGNTNGWVSASLSSTVKRNGSKALKISSTSYATLKNLELHTQYTISIYCYQSSATNFRATVSAENANGKSDVIVSKAVTGVANSWQEVKVTFCTVNNPSATFKLEGISSNTYLDDFSLIKDVTASPTTYFNDDSTANTRWNRADEENVTTFANGVGTVSATSEKTGTHYIYSSPFLVKKGAKYTLTFNLAYSNVTNDQHTQVLLSYTPDEDDRYSLDSSLSTWYLNNSKKENIGSFITFAAKKADKTVKVTFTAHNTSSIYLMVNFQGVGTVTVSNVNISESNFDPSNYVKEQSLAHVGSAIRTEGVQGLRYKTEIDKHFLTAENEEPYDLRFIEYGTLAIKTEYLNGKELTLGGSYTYNNKTKIPGVGVAYSFKDGINKIFAEDANRIYFTGVLTGIGTKNYNTYYTTRAYFKYLDENGNEQVIYTPQNEVAIYPVAKAAYSARDINNKLVEDETVREYLLNNIISRFTDKSITINSDNVINSDFQGITSTVYHGTIFFEDSHGRKYTEEQAAIEMDRLKDSGITNVRTRLSSEWMWDKNLQVEGCSEKGGWNWNSTKMQAFYKWAKMLQDRGITITLNIGWHLVDFTDMYAFFNKDENKLDTSSSKAHSSIAEVNYLHGINDSGDYTAPRYNEDSKAEALKTAGKSVELDLSDNEFEHFSIAAARYAEWGKQALEALKAQGITVDYIMPFTETGYYTVETGGSEEQDPTYCYDEWIFFTMALHDTLNDAGIRDDYKLIGPAQSENISTSDRSVKFVEYIYDKIDGSTYADMIDINAMHAYPKPSSNNDIYTPGAIYTSSSQIFNHYDTVLNNAGQRAKEFWCDEYFIKSDKISLGDDVGMLLTQFAVGMIAGMNRGINRFISWQMFDTLWDANATHTTGEFVGGIHEVGTCPRLIGGTCSDADCGCKDYTEASYTPRTTYYGINLLGKYMSDKNGAKVLKTYFSDAPTKLGEDGENGIFTSAIKRSDGKTVILVVNTSDIVTTVNVNSGIAKGSFDRYLYDPNEVEPTVDATSIPSDKSIAVVDGSFHDAIPAQSFAIYVNSDVQYGDVDMDGGNLFN